ncbi:hypothetical protein L207DRAFT_634758 [Hyaloscypha variabilis F]|uniref:Heterokaryon incompatibility domain-containing protein n=1 Tax=Hyaloscypha variabilis (strain UAMH 11265 / GT02V1 / F) TaxID=1149755 RepID=A0A2J6RJU3_HYAVF|nr:hypothetical protein L207DRAFT_634758 [Hyaloscypha variabilis F]
MSKSYQYQSLATPSTIRLIKILPDQVMGDIVCIIHHFDQAITPNLNYCAVSYRWGDPEPTQTIRLGDAAGNTHSHPLHENLWQLLHHLWQQKMFDRLYWTDSLCLHQKDTQEISEQVPRMGEIYSTAEEVLVWLGHEREGEDALKLIRDWPGPVDWGPVDIGNEEEVEWANSVEVQEVVLARKAYVAYGNISLDINDFRSRVNHFRRATSELSYQPTIWSLCNLRQTGAKKPLWEITTEFNYCASSRTIDKVYGFLGLVADRENDTSPAHLIEVNKDKEPYEVFWDTVFECCAPWNKYSSVILSLGQLLWEKGESRANWDFRMLQKYASAARTSERHVIFAKLALCVFDAANTIRMLTGAEFQEWSKAISGVLSSAMQMPCEFTLLQNAAAVGLALTAVRRESQFLGVHDRSSVTLRVLSWSNQLHNYLLSREFPPLMDGCPFVPLQMARHPAWRNHQLYEDSLLISKDPPVQISTTVAKR